MFAVEPGLLGPRLGELGRRLPRPRAAVVLSPHWMTRGVRVQSGAALDTVHDFGGFPRELYSLQYPAPAAPALAAEVIATLAHHGIEAIADAGRGRDHGAWVPLMHLFPAADVPVIQVSQPAIPSPLALLELGQALATLREQDILFVASGSLTHNLHEVFAEHAAQSGVEAYASTFADWVWKQIDEGALGELLDYRKKAPFAVRAHPTDEHFLPLFAAIGAAGKDWTQSARISGCITHDVLAMDSFMFGTGPGLAPPNR
ncbi:MAG: dioxygenase [Azoarcus sp.]|nr:MAG: dioxygenase [Azoarcus sp.]